VFRRCFCGVGVCFGITVVIWGRRSGGGDVLNIRRLEFSLCLVCDGGFCGGGLWG
jgi:hypothetical protein